MRDVVIIGAGVAGCATARELSRYQLDICVVERCEDVCCGTSKANSAIVHAGYDAEPGSLKAKLNRRGSEVMEELSRTLDFPYKRNGSLVLCMDENKRKDLEELYQRGLINGIKELRIIEKDEILKMEPNVSENVVAALYAPTAGIVCPFNLTIALAENAAVNGTEFCFNTTVTGLESRDGYYIVHTDKGDIETRTVVNAAGVYADTIHNMVCPEAPLHIVARRGDYFLFDKTAGSHVNRTIFTLPGPLGKGILTAPTVHGNLLAGPTAIDVEDKDAVNTTLEGFDQIRSQADMTMKSLPMRQVITSFAGLRAHEDGGDFVIGECAGHQGFFDCAGIESPGLSAAPAIGEMLAELVSEKLSANKKEDFIENRTGVLHPDSLSTEERNKLIAENPAYGNIICRCEMVSEGEIVDAIRRPVGAKSLDGIKRRTRAGMGRCQAGFCSPKTISILARELGVSMEEITKCGGDSRFIFGKTREAEQNA